MQRAAGSQQLRPGGTMDRTIHSTTTQQRRVCCVHNRIYLELCNVAAHDL
jgi:hypothetical protein